VLAFERHHDGQTLLCAFNLSPDPTDWAAPYPVEMVERVGSVDGGRLGDYAGYIGERRA
jgi:hypothetical protein